MSRQEDRVRALLQSREGVAVPIMEIAAAACRFASDPRNVVRVVVCRLRDNLPPGCEIVYDRDAGGYRMLQHRMAG